MHISLACVAGPIHIGCVNSKQRKTLAGVFRTPTSATMAWDSVENLLVAVGCEVIEGPGTSVSFERDGMVEFFHRPHPAKEAKRYQVRAVKAFLIKMGIEP